MDTQNKILHELLDLGEAMLINGAEVKRVEDTLNRMGAAYGASRMNVFVITSSVVVTMTLADGRELTQTRRIAKPGGTDFRKLEELNALSRRCCMLPLPPEELQREIHRLTGARTSRVKFYGGSILAAGSFSVFFGGGLTDGIAAALFAVLVCVLQEHMSPYCTNTVIFNFLCALLTGLAICTAANLLGMVQIVVHIDKVIIGDIMLLIPGIAMTNAVRDVLLGDTISGVMRLTETLLWAVSLACGFMSAIWLIGG